MKRTWARRVDGGRSNETLALDLSVTDRVALPSNWNMPTTSLSWKHPASPDRLGVSDRGPRSYILSHPAGNAETADVLQPQEINLHDAEFFGVVLVYGDGPELVALDLPLVHGH